VPKVTIVPKEFDREGIGILRLACLAGLARSNGEARRLILNNGLRMDGKVINDINLRLSLELPVVLQKGKDKFVEVKKGS
jgi:tyrosyl-tRNA synthetase